MRTASAYDIVIVGAGIAGATLACALGGSSFKVALLERSPPVPPPQDDYDLRVSAITLAARTVFEQLGVWQAMQRRRPARIEAMEVWTAAGSGRIRFEAAEIGEPCLGWIVENSAIRLALLEGLQRFTNVHLVCPAEVADLQLGPAGAQLTLADGRPLQTALVVGADGAASAVRRAAGIAIVRHDLGQHAMVCTVRTSMPHEHVARQVFLATGPLAFLPLAEPQACSIVWSAQTARAQALMALDEAGFKRALQEAFGDGLGQLVAVGARAAFPLALSHARAYTAEHVALIGDAAHSVHPLAGQGANLGILDAAALAEVLLKAAERGKDIGAHHVLRRYERARKSENLALLAVTGGLRYLFGASVPGLATLGALALKFADTVDPFKRLLMRRASGLTGDLPRLARRMAP